MLACLRSFLFFLFVGLCASLSFHGNLFAGASNPTSFGVAEEYVDLIELNHFYDHKGRYVYSQSLFWTRDPRDSRFHIRAWVLIDDRLTYNRRPLRDEQSDQWFCQWYDQEQKILRKIRSKMYRESWTQVDPERADKAFLGEADRIALIKKIQPADVAKESDSSPPLEDYVVEVVPENRPETLEMPSDAEDNQ